MKKVSTIFVLGVITALMVLATGSSILAQAGDDTQPVVRLKSREIAPAAKESGASLAFSVALEEKTADWHGLILLDGPLSKATDAQLSEAGVTLLEYIPDHAWLASMPPSADLLDIEGVAWIGDLAPEDKLQQDIKDGIFAMSDVIDGTTAFWIDVYNDVDMESAVVEIEQNGGFVLATYPELSRLSVQMRTDEIQQLAPLDIVQWIEQQPSAPQELNDLTITSLEADELFTGPYSLDGDGVTALVWDVGLVDPAHPDFNGRLITPNTGPSIKSHATHVAGILAGNGANSVTHGGDPLQYRGVAPGTEVVSYAWGNTVTTHQNAIADYGIDLSQNSWGIGTTNCPSHGQYSSYSQGYDEIITGIYGKRVPVVFAVGNSQGYGGNNCGSRYGTILGGPQSGKNVISVGAVDAKQDGSPLGNASSMGPTADGRLKPEVVANGVVYHSTCIGGGYCGYGGTSQAAPAVSGVISLMNERHASTCGPVKQMLPSTYRAIIAHTAFDMDDDLDSRINKGPDFGSGYGIVNAQNSVDMVPFHLEGVIDHSNVLTYQILVTNRDELKVTIAWDDVPAAPNSALSLINNIDIELIEPNGNIFHGPWELDHTASNEATPAPRQTWAAGTSNRIFRDTLNNMEQVVVDAPTPGLWTIQVRGTNIPQGPQSFSLVNSALQQVSCNGDPTDLWISDSFQDDGVEPNSVSPGQPALWNSNRIWVRRTEDTAFNFAYQSESPIRGDESFVYVEVENLDNAMASGALVELYWANPLLGLTWPQDWHFIGSDGVANINGSDQQTAVINWTPANTQTATPYRLLARVVTPDDPMTVQESADIETNLRENNNLAALSVVALSTGDKPTAVNFVDVSASTDPTLWLAIALLIIVFTISGTIVVRKAQNN